MDNSHCIVSVHKWLVFSVQKILLWSHAAGLQCAFKSDEWRADHLHGTKMVFTGLTGEWQRSEGGRRTKNEWQKTKDSTKTELVVDNNLLWRSKAYSFGHFVRNLCGDPTHVQDTGSPFPHPRLLLIAAWNLNLHHSFPIWEIDRTELTGSGREGVPSDYHVTTKAGCLFFLNHWIAMMAPPCIGTEFLHPSLFTTHFRKKSFTFYVEKEITCTFKMALMKNYRLVPYHCAHG